MSKKLSRVFLLTAILIVSLCMSAFVAITQTRTVSAANADFTMVDGAALRISDDDGGIRFRVKMNAATANKFKNGDAELKIAIAPKAIFATVTDGNYAELSQKIELTADKNKIYQDGDYYYANGVITNILEENRKLDFCAVAYYTEGNNTVYAAFNADVTCGNVYDIVNQLVVSYGDIYAADILACKSYAWYGVGDYPITINTVEQYNALAAQVNNGRDFSKYTAVIADEVKSASGKTEITNAEKFPMQQDKYDTTIYKTMIYECAGHSLSNTNGFEKSTEVTAPNGFKNVYKSTTFAGFDIGHDLSIANYKKVCFALKSDGKYKHSALGEVDGQSGWVYFELSRESVSSFDWTIRLIDERNKTLLETQRHDNNKWNFLCSILWHGGTDFTMSGATYTYCTELREGKDKLLNFNPLGYDEKIYECAGHSLSNTNGFEKSTEVTAPNGFKNVYKSTTFAGFDIGHDLSIANYKKVCFALKSDGKYKHSALGEVDGQSDWVYFELSRESVESFDWTIRIIDENKVLLFETQRTDNNKWNFLCSILWHGGADFTMSGATYTYCSELRGESDNRYNTNAAQWTESHWFESENTENYMVKDGQTEYTVVIPSAPSGMINYAKEELNAFFLKQRG